MEKNNPWHLLLSGNREQAFAIWNETIAKINKFENTGIGSSVRAFNARGLAYLYIGEIGYALLDFTRARKDDPSLSHEYIGVALWLLDDNAKACLDWSMEIERLRSGEVHFTDAGGGVRIPSLLWWASRHVDKLQGNEYNEYSEKELRRLWRAEWLQKRGWPRPVAGFLLGEISSTDLIEQADSSVNLLKDRRLCQAYFYIAASKLAKNSLAQYRNHLEMSYVIGNRLVSSSAPVFETEYFLAKNYLSKAG